MSQPSSWAGVFRRFRLGWRLLRDPLVPVWTKLIPLGAVVYLLFPMDLIPDAIPVLGQLDDLGVLLLALRAFIALCPREVVLRHEAAMSPVDGAARQVNDSPLALAAAKRPPENGAGQRTVDGKSAG